MKYFWLPFIPFLFLTCTKDSTGEEDPNDPEEEMCEYERDPTWGSIEAFPLVSLQIGNTLHSLNDTALFELTVLDDGYLFECEFGKITIEITDTEFKSATWNDEPKEILGWAFSEPNTDEGQTGRPGMVEDVVFFYIEENCPFPFVADFFGMSLRFEDDGVEINLSINGHYQ